MSTQPKALEIAAALDDPDADGFVTTLDQTAATELRRLQGEVESMRAERIATEKRVSVLHAAFEASEASDAESLRLYRAARERADKLQELNAQMLEALEYVEYFANGKPEWDMVRAAIDAAKGQA